MKFSCVAYLYLGISILAISFGLLIIIRSFLSAFKSLSKISFKAYIFSCFFCPIPYIARGDYKISAKLFNFKSVDILSPNTILSNS